MPYGQKLLLYLFLKSEGTGKGATFTLILTSTDQENAVVSPNFGTPILKTYSETKIPSDLNILLVEDNTTTNYVMAKLFTRLGHR